MILERKENEILVPLNLDISELQDMLDYLEYKELTMNVKVPQEALDEISDVINKEMWAKVVRLGNEGGR